MKCVCKIFCQYNSISQVTFINNIFDSFTPTEQERIHDFMLNLPLGTTLVLELPEMRDDPRDECGGKSLFRDGVGYGGTEMECLQKTL